MSSHDPVAPSLSGHLRTLGICWIVYGVLRLIMAVCLVIYGSTATVMFGTLLSWRPDYDPFFYRQLSRRARRIYLFRDEYLFDVEKAVVVETPQLGHATYVFAKPRNMDTFLTLYTKIMKDDIRRNRNNVAERLGFLGRDLWHQSTSVAQGSHTARRRGIRLRGGDGGVNHGPMGAQVPGSEGPAPPFESRSSIDLFHQSQRPAMRTVLARNSCQVCQVTKQVHKEAPRSRTAIT